MASKELLSNHREEDNTMRAELIEALIEMCEDRCATCKVFNPQHKDCPSCDDIEDWRKVIEKATDMTWQEIQEERHERNT